jgi:hypothetical protein
MYFGLTRRSARNTGGRPTFIYKKLSRGDGETFGMSVNIVPIRDEECNCPGQSKAFIAFRNFTVGDNPFVVQDFDDVTGRITWRLWFCTTRRSGRLQLRHRPVLSGTS